MLRTNLSLTVRKIRPELVIVDINGDVTAAAEGPLMETLITTKAEGVRVIALNFGGLTYMNSSGIGMLVTFLIRAKRQSQRVVAYGLNEHYRQIFELTKLNEVIHVYDAEAEVLVGEAAT
jgi:anti-sigma B factor antagonist